jgi:ABC-type multidrug transport system ATPase subunit
VVKGKIMVVDTPEKIKQSVRGTPVTEALLSGDPDTPMIHELEDMGKVECTDRMVRVETEDFQEAIEALIRLSSQRGLRIEEVNTLRPSLEDAFVELPGVSTEAMSTEKENRRR